MTEWNKWDKMWSEVADKVIDYITQNAAPMAYTREEIYSLVPDCSYNPWLVDRIIDKWVNIPTQYMIPTDVLRSLLMGGEINACEERTVADTNALLTVLGVSN